MNVHKDSFHKYSVKTTCARACAGLSSTKSQKGRKPSKVAIIIMLHKNNFNSSTAPTEGIIPVTIMAPIREC